MSFQKVDTVNALCLAHRIIQYEKPLPKKYILMKFKNKTLKIAAHLLLQVSHEVINCINTNQRTTTEASQGIAPMGGWDTTPTSFIRLKTKIEYVTEYNPSTGVINNNYHDYGYTEPGIYFDICEGGKEYVHVKTPMDQHYVRHKGPEEVTVSLKTSSALDDTFRRELVEMLGDHAVILMDFITFDKNMRLVDQISTIDGWNFEIKYINYDIPRPVKRQRTV